MKFEAHKSTGTKVELSPNTPLKQNSQNVNVSNLGAANKRGNMCALILQPS